MPFGLARSGQTMNRTRSKTTGFNSKIDWIFLVVSITGPVVLYLLSMPRTVALEDDGLFLMAGANLGVAHPPGYPLYTLIVYLFTKLPFGSVAFLGHLSSAVLGALACGCLFLCARQLNVSSVPALTASWLFAASEHFWSQAIITEVYTLNALLFFSLYLLVLFGLRQPNNTWVWIAVAAIYGMSLSNHWPLMILSTPGLVVLAFPVWRIVYRKLPKLVGAFLFSATIPYVWMVWRSHQNTSISFYGPIKTLNEFWIYISRKGYAIADSSPSAGWHDRLEFMHWLGTEMILQLTIPGFAFAVIGLVVLIYWRRYTWIVSGGLVVLGNSLVLICLIRYDFDFIRIAIFRPYSLLCYGILALWAAVGIQFILYGLVTKTLNRFTRRSSNMVVAASILGFAMVSWSVHDHWRVNNRSEHKFINRYVEMVYNFLPNDATLFVEGDYSVPIGYYKYLENNRPDITLLSLDGLIYDNRLYDPFLPADNKHAIIQGYMKSTDSAVFTIGYNSIMPSVGMKHYGFFREVITDSEPDHLVLSAHRQGEVFFEELIKDQFTDRWEQHFRSILLFNYGKYLGLVIFSENQIYLDSMQNLLKLAEDDFTCTLGIAYTLLQYGNSSHWDRVSRLLTKAESLKHSATSKSRIAVVYFLRGILLLRQGEEYAANALFRRSYNLYPHPDNEVIKYLNTN